VPPIDQLSSHDREGITRDPSHQRQGTIRNAGGRGAGGPVPGLGWSARLGEPGWTSGTGAWCDTVAPYGPEATGACHPDTCHPERVRGFWEGGWRDLAETRATPAQILRSRSGRQVGLRALRPRGGGLPPAGATDLHRPGSPPPPPPYAASNCRSTYWRIPPWR
jgi:hypothetical protein